MTRCDRLKKTGPSLARSFLHQQLPQRFSAIKRHHAKRAACERKMQLTSHNARAPRSTYEPLQTAKNNRSARKECRFSALGALRLFLAV
ncbi:hypothetical protein, partial [Xanthomonas fragariae]|uniref:hypothetical protein n=1 Tax=Xanthomonas fragariae TaxID=48664 RepID=UPI001F471EC5